MLTSPLQNKLIYKSKYISFLLISNFRNSPKLNRKNDEEKTRSRPVSTNLETAIDMPPALPDVPKEKIGEGYGSESGCGSSGLVTITKFFALSNFFTEIQFQIYHCIGEHVDRLAKTQINCLGDHTWWKTADTTLTPVGTESPTTDYETLKDKET